MDVLDPRRVLIFRAVARAGSISAAARDLGWTQPAVSQHLARLERDVGGPLLLRGAAGVRLTQAGTALEAGFTPSIRHVTDDYVVVQNLVAAGLGVSVLPASALAAHRAAGVRSVELPELGRRQVGLVFRPGADAVPATAAVAAALARAAG